MRQQPYRSPNVLRLRQYLPALLLLPPLILVGCGPSDLPIQAGKTSDCRPIDPQQKIDARLCQVLWEIHSSDAGRDGTVDLSGLSTPLVRVDRFGRIEAYVSVARTDAAALASLRRLGMAIELISPDRRVVQGWIPFTAFDEMAAQEMVERIEPPVYGKPK